MEAFAKLIGAFIVFLVFGIVYLFFGIKYKMSKKLKGRVIESKGTEIVYFGGRYLDEIYETYDVRYFYKNKMFIDEVRTNKTGLKAGAPIDVYVYDPNGSREVQTDIYWRKFTRYSMFGVLMGTVLLIIMIMIWLVPKTMDDSSYVRENHTYSSVYTDEEYEQMQKQAYEYYQKYYSDDINDSN